MYFILLVAIGLLLIIIPLSEGSADLETEQTLEEYRESLEEEVASLASGIKGVGRCRVLITFERGSLNTYKGGTLTETRPPLVSGVTAVCDGAENDQVRARLTEMITALFGIQSNRVAVLKAK